MKHFVRLAATCLCMLPWVAPLPSFAQSWTFCAAENTLCRVNGPSVVRFGVGDRFEHRNVSGPVMCNNKTFGDPAPGEKKDWSYRSSDSGGQGAWQNTSGWSTCARENTRCSFSGSKEVRYGADGRYRTRFAYGGVQCDNRSFGGDPLPGQPKECQVRGGVESGYPNRPPPVIGGASNDGWRHCAEENGTCYVTSTATVRFGSQGRYAYVNGVRDRVACTIGVFGDPHYGERKSCEYKESGGGTGSLPSGWDTYPEQPAPVDSGWVPCGVEDSVCNVPGVTTVRFGAQGRYAFINRVNGRITCSKEVFGDPIEGVRKTCEYAR